MLNKMRQMVRRDTTEVTNFSKIIKALQKNSIRIAYSTIANQDCPVGCSKIGGKPDLPIGFEWFYYEGKAYTDDEGVYNESGVVKNRPLSFLAQINCEEVHEFDTEKVLPSKGMLYFFYELEAMTWGFSPGDKGSARVYYYPEKASELYRTDFPSDLPNEYPKKYHLPEMAISFSSKNDIPDFEEFAELYDGIEKLEHKVWIRLLNEYGTAREIPLYEDTPDERINKLLGYANLVQGGMLMECELTTSGINTGSPDGYANITAEQKEKAKNWRLLFQLDSICTDDYEMLWGDMGRIYFYIKDEDLRNLNFEGCWLVLQCG